MNKPNFPVVPALPASALYRSRLVIPSTGLEYKTLLNSDLVYDSGAYTTFSGVQSGDNINITLAGNTSTTDMGRVAYANFDTLIPSDPTSDETESWLCSIYLSFDTSSFSGSEEQNLGVYFFSGDPDLVGVGTGYYGGGTISKATEANRSLVMNDYVQRKNASGMAFSTSAGDVVSTATQMALTAQITRYGNGGSGSSANKINSTFASIIYGNAGGWVTNNKTDSFAYQTDTGSTLQIGFWASRNTTGSFTHTFTINQFAYALLPLRQ